MIPSREEREKERGVNHKLLTRRNVMADSQSATKTLTSDWTRLSAEIWSPARTRRNSLLTSGCSRRIFSTRTFSPSKNASTKKLNRDKEEIGNGVGLRFAMNPVAPVMRTALFRRRSATPASSMGTNDVDC